MITRITRLLLVLQIAVAILLFIVSIKIWHVDSILTASALSIGFVLLFRLLITANNFFIARFYCSETPSDRNIDWLHACLLLKDEFKASMLSSSWTMPFHSFTKRPAKNPSGLPVLLIHGYGCNSGYWHAMSKLLTKENITHYAVDLEPVFSDIDHYVPLVAQAVTQVCSETGHEKIIILAHSMGGLVARAYLRDHGCTHIAKVITLGTPHHGTGLANFGAGPSSKQMRWQGKPGSEAASDWLCALERTEDSAVRALFVSIYSHHDNIISPQTSSYLEGATNIEFHGIGHVALAFDPVIQNQVIKEIQNTSSELAAIPVANLA